MEEKDELNEKSTEASEEAEVITEDTYETEGAEVSSFISDENGETELQPKDRCRWLAYCFIASFAAELSYALMLLLSLFSYSWLSTEAANKFIDISCYYLYAVKIFSFVLIALEIAFVIFDIVKLKKEGVRITAGMWVCIIFTPFYLLARNKQKKTRSFYKNACIIFWVLNILALVATTYMTVVLVIAMIFKAIGQISSGS